MELNPGLSQEPSMSTPEKNIKLHIRSDIPTMMALDAENSPPTVGFPQKLPVCKFNDYLIHVHSKPPIPSATYAAQ